MHTVHVTQGLVLGKRAAGESNLLVAILTRELGLVRAAARSARKEASKLRYGLEPLTAARFSFVRGKSEWKLTGVEHIKRLAPRQSARAGKVSRLLLRLVSGEEPSAALFDTVVEGFAALATIADYANPSRCNGEAEADAESIECVLVLRILSSLGYLPHTPELAPFIEQDFFSLELSSRVKASRAALIRTINESLGATGL